MLFGLENTSETFQLAMGVVLANVNRQYALLYIDDIVVYFRRPQSHLRHIEEELLLLNNAGVIIKLKERLFFSKRTTTGPSYRLESITNCN